MKATPIYQYDAKGNFLREYRTYKDAAIDVNRNRSNIRKAVRRKNKSAGFYYSEIFFEKFPAVRDANRYILAYKKADSSTWVECTSLKQASAKTNIPTAVIKWMLTDEKNKNTFMFKDLRTISDPKKDLKLYYDKDYPKPWQIVLQKGTTKKTFQSRNSAAKFLNTNTFMIASLIEKKQKYKGWSIKRVYPNSILSK